MIMRKKHRNDHNHGKQGWIGGNPRHGRARGHRRAEAPKLKAQFRKQIRSEQ